MNATPRAKLEAVHRAVDRAVEFHEVKHHAIYL